MALNPPLLPTGLPAGLAAEFFLLERDGVELTVDLGGSLRKQTLKNARLFVTTLRLCVVAPAATASGLQSMDMPLQCISEESFKQPIFGANSLVGRVAPVPGRGLDTPASFQLYFYKGGCGTFLRILFHLLGTYREMDERGRAAFFAPANMAQQMPTFQAFVDPSDPSRLFLSQPPSAAPPQQQQQASGSAAPPPPGFHYG